jgi:hypothetical protein
VEWLPLAILWLLLWVEDIVSLQFARLGKNFWYESYTGIVFHLIL